MIATFYNNHICPCGYGILKDNIPVGTIYKLDENTKTSMIFVCGGCNKIFDVVCMIAWRNSEYKGFLPVCIFKEFQQ